MPRLTLQGACFAEARSMAGCLVDTENNIAEGKRNSDTSKHLFVLKVHACLGIASNKVKHSSTLACQFNRKVMYRRAAACKAVAAG